MLKKSLTRRSVLKTAALTPPALAAVSLPFVHGAYAAGKLSIGAWDHWVPGATQVLEKMCQEWAAKEKVELKIDYIPSQNQKNLITIAAEAQAKAGHDILAMPTWWAAADHLVRGPRGLGHAGDLPLQSRLPLRNCVTLSQS